MYVLSTDEVRKSPGKMGLGGWQRHVYHSAPRVSSLFANWGRRLLSRSENGNAFFITKTFMLIRNIQLLPEIN